MHTPKLLHRELADETATTLASSVANGIMTVHFKDSDVPTYKGLMLHETLFHYYKAWYNYLAARALYPTGLLHWIDITLYYSRFYLARASLSLIGHSTIVTRQRREFLLNVAQALGKPQVRQLRIKQSVDLVGDSISLLLDCGKFRSHQDVWHQYVEIPHHIGLYDLAHGHELLERFGAGPDFLSQERNEENYSFNGYAQVDFNLPLGTFEQFFERDMVKAAGPAVYEDNSADVFLCLSSFYRLLESLKVPGLPIELSKHKFLIEYTLPPGDLRDHLIVLCDEGFVVENLFSDDGVEYVDDQGRNL